jgi:hypothetical protein
MMDLTAAPIADPMMMEEPVIDVASAYWAKSPEDKIGGEIIARVEAHHDRMESGGHYDNMRKSYAGWYGESLLGASSSQVRFGGKQGELVLSKANVFRAVGRQMLALVVKHRPSFNCRAANLDYESQAQAITADSVLEHYMRRERLERHFNETTETGFVVQQGYLRMRWDTERGVPYGVDPETEKPVMTGDIVADTLTAFDVMHDPRRKYGSWDWVIARDFRNKYDLATRYPALAEKLTKLDGKEAWEHSLQGDPEDEDAVDIPVYEFYHRPTPAVPKGRHVIVADADCVLFDGPMPYDRIPVLQLVPSYRIGTSLGYTDLYDCIGPQELLDSVLTAIMSNYDAHSVQNIWKMKTTQIEPNALPGGGHVWNGDQGDAPPQGINLVRLPEGWKDLLQWIESIITKQVGSNDVARGDPTSVTSGAMAAAFMQSAIEFSGNLEENRTRLIEDGLDLAMAILKAYAHAPRLIEIAGKDKEYMMKEWSSKDISGAAHVVVDSGNAMQRTFPGRMEMGEKFIQLKGNSEMYNSYVEVVTTGKLDPIISRAQRQRMLIRRENDVLAKGPQVRMRPVTDPMTGMPAIDPMTGQPQMEAFGVEGLPVTLADLHPDHMNEHSGILDSPDARANPDIIAAVYAHDAEHDEVWRTADPSLLAALGIPPYPAAPMPMAPTGEPGAPPEMGSTGDAGQPTAPEPAKDPLGRDGAGEEMPA